MIQKKLNLGFTLIELLIGITLVAILASLAGPSFSDFLQNNRATAYTNQFIAALNFARSEALKRNATVNIDAVDGSESANEWGKGWVIAVNGEDLAVGASFGGGAGLDSVGNIVQLGFTAKGFSNNGQQVFQLRVPGCSGSQGRDITVDASGRISVARVAC